MTREDFNAKKLFPEITDQVLMARYDKRYSDLAMRKSGYIPLYKEIEVLGDPKNAYFRTSNSKGQRSAPIAKTDDTLQACLPIHCAVMNSLLTPAAYVWHQMRFADGDAQEQFGTQLSLQNDYIYKKRYSAASNFVCAINTIYMNNALYGWYVLEVTKDITKKQVCYRALPVSEFVIDQNERGFVDTFYRKVSFKYRQLRQRFPNYVPASAKNTVDGQDPWAWLDKDVELMHVVEPSLEAPGKFDSVYIDMTEKAIIEKTVEDRCKYIAGRSGSFSNTNDPYGYSAVMSVLPSTKNLNAVSFDVIKAVHHAQRFDLLAGEDVINPRNYPDVTSIIQGGIDSDGRPQVGVLNQRDMPTVEHFVNDWRKRIKEALFVDLFISLQDTQSRSATDAMLKANERANIVAPMGDRIVRELLQPLIELELYYYSDMGVLPKFPEEAEGEEFHIVLDNPMMRGQRLDSANAIANMTATMTTAMQLDTEFNMDRTKQYLAESYNIPLTILNTDEEKQSILQERQQQAEMQSLMENAGNIGSGIKNLSDVVNPAQKK